MPFMVIEKFRNQNGKAVYRKLRDAGRGLPEGLRLVASYVSTDLGRCFQIMETDDVTLFQRWIADWQEVVEFEVANTVDRFFPAAAPARESLRTREQLRERIGLGQVIVAAGPQPLYPVVDLAQRRKNECRRLDAFASQRADDRQPVKLGQHTIDNQHVILAVERVGEPLLAVGRQLGDMPDLAERLGEVVGGIAVVFDYQKTHDEPVVSRIGDFPCGRLVRG